MAEFLLKRLATIVPTLIFVSMLNFGLQQLLPGELTYAQDLGQSLSAVVKIYMAMGGSWVDAAAR